MKSFLPLILLLSLGVAALVPGQVIPINHVDNDGFGGVYDINGQNYWWMCIEPNGSSATTPGNSSFLADALLFEPGWDQQNTERQNFYQSNPGYYTTAIPTQVRIMEYVLDAYLPWNTLAGASGRFAEQDSNAANYGNDDAFYNAFFAVQNFLSETYGKTVKGDLATDFDDLNDYLDYNAGNMTAAGIARSSIFQSILNDVETKNAASFFDTYSAQHGYFIANTLFSVSDPSNWQDALVIASFTPVPEPSGALLIACCGVVVILRRWRKLA